MRRRVTIHAALVISLLLMGAPALLADDRGIGTWVKRAGPGSAGGPEYTMVVEAWGTDGRRLTHKVKLPNGEEVITVVECPMDGSDVPVMLKGKPGGESVGIKWLDRNRTATVHKVNGKRIGTSRATLSADARTLTVEYEMAVAWAGRKPGKTTEVWVRR